MERARDGTFLPRAPVMADLPRAPHRPKHAYEKITDGVGAHNPSLFMPCIWEAKSSPPPGVRRYDRLWKQELPWRTNVQRLLDVIAGLLDCQEYYNDYDGAMVPFAPLRDVFAEPLHGDQCMTIQRAFVGDVKNVYMNKHGYAQLTLFYQAGKEVRINAHAFILWAVKGMPQSAFLSQAMHCCDAALEDAACVQPQHLDWGTPSENAHDYRWRLGHWNLEHSPRRNLRRKHR